MSADNTHLTFRMQSHPVFSIPLTNFKAEVINLPMSVTATTDAAKLTVLLHNCCLHMGISIILNQKLWASRKNCWVNWTVLIRSKI